MTLEEQLKREILNRYKSIREFSSMTGIPYSTVDSVLKRGIKNSGVGTVIRIFSFLDIDVESISFETLKHLNTAVETKNSPSTAEAILGEEFYQEVTCLAGRLSPEQQDLFLALLRLTAARNQGLPVADLVSAGEAALKSELQNPTQ